MWCRCCMYQSVFVVLKYDYLTQLWELFVILTGPLKLSFVASLQGYFIWVHVAQHHSHLRSWHTWVRWIQTLYGEVGCQTIQEFLMYSINGDSIAKSPLYSRCPLSGVQLYFITAVVLITPFLTILLICPSKLQSTYTYLRMCTCHFCMCTCHFCRQVLVHALYTELCTEITV